MWRLVEPSMLVGCLQNLCIPSNDLRVGAALLAIWAGEGFTAAKDWFRGSLWFGPLLYSSFCRIILRYDELEQARKR